jgi:tetratricopeptide (TPR) repeat protein
MKQRPSKSKAGRKPEGKTPPGKTVPAGLVAPLSAGRKWLFRFVAASLPFIVLLLAEIAFRIIPGLNEDRDPYVNISPVSIFSRTVTGGQEYYNITHPQVIGGGGVHILVKKPANTIRIFCLGSSACAGWPHPPTETFSAYLQQALETAYPGKTVEVINAAAHGFAAYRTRRVLDEVLQMEPDAVIVWEGNNEFLEDRNYDPPNAVIVSLARHLRTIQWLRSIFASQNKLSGKELKDVAQFFWKRTRQQSLRLREDPVQFAQVQEHFRISIEHMVSQSQRRQVPIVLCTVPVNLRDWLPTVSYNRLLGKQLQQWQKLYNQARRCLIEGKYPDGIQMMNQAIAMENEHAESYFWLGRLLEADGQKAAAWEAFSKARDLDYNPFRAISSFNESIRALAGQNQHQGVYLLDLDNIFAGASKYAAPGFDLFLDYVHPTKPANLLVAQTAFDLITRDGVLKDKPAVKQFTYQDVPTGPNGKPYREETDLNLQTSGLTMATEGRQYETVLRKTETLLQEQTGHLLTGPDDPELKRFDPESVEKYRVFWDYLDVQRRVIMGLPVGETELPDAKRRVDEYYEKWYPLGRY